MSTQGLEAKVGRRIILASWDPQRNETEALEQELDEQKFLPGGDHFPLKCNLGPGGKGTEILAQCTPPPRRAGNATEVLEQLSTFTLAVSIPTMFCHFKMISFIVLKLCSIPIVVISQTHWLVSRVRLPRWRKSLALLNVQCCHLESGGGGSKFTAGVSHHTPPPLGGAALIGLCNQF